MLSGENWDIIRGSYRTNLDIREAYLLKNAETISPSPPRTLRLPPAGLYNLDRGKAYLKARGFVPDAIIQEYGLIITGTTGDYKFRIIIPIYQHGKLVSYQGRDYTGLSPIRYKACARENEIVHHKHLLYDADRVTGDHVIVVEGIVDKWKMGENTVCTFGTGFTPQQVNLLSKWGKVSILYDGEPEAQKHAEKLGEQLSGLGVDVDNIRLGKEDPGALSMEEARALSKEILGGQSLLSPERRFDAIIYNSPELFS